MRRMGQSAIEYLMTYGWMLLVVSVVGGAIFATVNSNCQQTSSGFSGSGIDVQDVGLSSNGELKLELRNTESDPEEVKTVKVVNEERETGVSATQNIDIPVGGSGVTSVSGLDRTSSCNTLNVKITYDTGNIKDKVVTGTVTGRFSPQPSLRPVWDSAVDWDQANSQSNTVHIETPSTDSDSVKIGYSPDSSKLESYYMFNSETDSLEDYSGDGDGSTAGDIRKLDDGLFGTPSWSFNSGNGRVRVPQAALSGTLSQNPVTIAFWFNQNDTKDNWPDYLGWQVQNETGSTFSIRTEKANDKDSIYTRFIAENSSCGYGVDDHGFWARNNNMGVDSDGNWQLYTVTFNGTKIREYVDGNIEASTTDVCDIADMSGDFQIIGSQTDYSIDNLMIYNRTLTKSEVKEKYNASNNGELITDWRKFESNKSVSSLQLQNVDSTLNGGSINVSVHSDLDGDGSVDEISDPISLTGSGGPYSISGLTTDSKRFRLEIDMSTPDRTKSPVFSAAEISS